jgi:ankyrin repeat protein
LHLSVYLGRLAISEILINAGAEISVLDKKQNWAPIHYAAALNDLDHLRLLHQKGADLNFCGDLKVSF